MKKATCQVRSNWLLMQAVKANLTGLYFTDSYFTV
jgi:hypothetical protein